MGDDKKQAKTVSNSEATSKSDAAAPSRGFVGGVNRSLPQSKNVQKAVVWALGIVVVVIAAWLVTMYVRSSSDVAFTVKDKTYSKALISLLAKIQTTEHNDGQTPKQAAKDLFTYFKEEQAASELGIAPSQIAITQEAEALRPSLQTYVLSDNEKSAIEKTVANKKFTQPKLPAEPTDQPYVNLWLSMVAYHNALKTSLVGLNEGQYQGFSFAFDFSFRVIPSDPEAPTPGHGDAKLIAGDQANAKKLADYYHDQILAGKLSAPDLLAQIKKDNRLGVVDKNILFSARNSTQFDTNLNPYLDGQVFFEPIVSYIIGQSKTGLSTVRLGQVSKASSAEKTQPADGFYYFVEIDSAKKAVSNAEKQLTEKVKSLKADYNGI